jgi:hypothetical protein
MLRKRTDALNAAGREQALHRVASVKVAAAAAVASIATSGVPKKPGAQRRSKVPAGPVIEGVSSSLVPPMPGV